MHGKPERQERPFPNLTPPYAPTGKTKHSQTAGQEILVFFEGSSVMITGGTGSFGRSFLANLLEQQKPRRVVIYSRDELKQYEMRQWLPADDQDRIRFFLGDIRDLERLSMAMRGIDYVVHAAALKQVDTAEYNPMSSSRRTSWDQRT